MKKYSQEWWLSLPPEKVGDETEKLVEALFKEENKRQDFAWHRLPDAKSGRGRIAAQPADYIISYNGARFLELKALKHPYRLPADRVTQLPTLQKFAMAGMPSAVLVFHYTTGQWRIVASTELPFGVPSWDLRQANWYSTAWEALASLGYVS